MAKVLSSIFPFEYLKKYSSEFFFSSLKHILGNIYPVNNKILDKLEKLAKDITNLPIEKKFSSAVEKSVKIFNFKKILIFIDDLDRLDPKDVFTILDSINIFFKVNGCIFILALDHYRINNAIYKETNNVPDVYRSLYLDKVIQLSINIPIENYNMRKYITNLFNLSDYEDKYKYITDIYIALITNSIGKTPRTIKILCAKYHFYYHILDNEFQNSDVLNYRDFFPFNEIYLKQALLAMLCFKYAYKDLYDLFLLSESFSKDFFHQIEYFLNGDDSKLFNNKLIIVLNKYKSDTVLCRNILKFISSFILAIEINENSANNFSMGGIFLLKATSKILMDKPILKTADYALPQKNSIDTNEINEYLNKYLDFYLEYLDDAIKCTVYDAGIKITFNFLCGPFTFQFIVLYKNHIIKIIIESPITKNFSYKRVINEWLNSACNGLPRFYFNPSEKAFINFEEIICEEFNNYKINKTDFFCKKVTSIFCNIFEELVTLKLSNEGILYKVKRAKDEFLSLINKNFKSSDGWIIDDNLNILDKWCSLSISHKNWSNKLSICIEPQDYFMQKIVVGIRKSTWQGKFKNHSEIVLRKQIIEKNDNINFEFSSYWVIYHFPIYDSYTSDYYYPSLKMPYSDFSEINSIMLSSLNIYKEFIFDITRLSHDALF